MAISVAIDGASSWEEADREVRRVVEATPEGLGRVAVEQIAAKAMISEHLLQAAATPERQAALAHYTEVLVQDNSPEGVVVGDALSALRGHWPEVRIVQAAESALRAVELSRAGEAACDGCTDEAVREQLARRAEGVEGIQNERAARAEVALAELRAVAGE